MKMLSRRQFIRTSALGTCALAASGALPGLGRIAQALSPRSRFLLLIHLQGGADSLAFVQPMTTDFTLNLRLNIKRPNIFLKDENLLSLAGTNWGVRNSLPVFEQAWNEKNLALIHGVGVPNLICNHETAEQVMAAGIHDANLPATSGWVQRMMQIAQVKDPMAVLDFAGGHFTTSAGGTYRPMAYRSMSNARSLRSGTETQIRGSENYFRLDILTAALRQGHNLKGKAEIEVNNHLKEFGERYDDLNRSFDSLPGGYGNNHFEQSVRQVDAVIRDLEAEGRATVAFVPFEGWDSHTNQNSFLGGRFTELNRALSLLKTNLTNEGKWNQTAILVYSEHGRRIDENGEGGTDHAPNQMMFLLGGAVRGGVYGSWPSRGEIDAALGYISRQRNAVDVYHSLATGLGYNANAIFPGYTPAGLNLIK